jgi:shikimate kinase
MSGFGQMKTARKTNLIFLTGYMGAGKSTIGRRLATALGYRFIDTDKALEKHFRRKMSVIFKEVGEIPFREEEERLIEKLAYRSNYVVSCGGGTLTRTETFYTAQRAGILIYLSAPLDVLFERTIFSQKDRPLLNIPNTEARFKARFKTREPYYIRADYTTETANRQSDEVVQDIIAWLRQQP